MTEAVSTHTMVSPLRLFLAEFGESRVSVFAVVVLGLIILLAVAAPLITPQNPYDLATLVLTDARRHQALSAAMALPIGSARMRRGETCFRQSCTACESRFRSG